MRSFTTDELKRIEANPKLLSEFREIIYSYGCFVVKGCFDIHFVTKVHKTLEKLFSKPEEEKLKYKVDKIKNPTASGFSPYGVSRAMDTGIPNSLETWDVNKNKDNWPSDMMQEGDIIREFNSKLYKLSEYALELTEIVLGVPEDSLKSLVHEKNGGIHLIHYFPFDPKFGRRSRRQSKHRDNSLLTLIPSINPPTSPISVYNRKTRKWIDVTVGKDECLVQTGLLLERLTNDKVRANLHTVRNPAIGSKENADRYSTPFFLSPSPDVVLSVLEGFRRGQNVYPDITVKQAQAEYFDKIFRKK